MTAFIDHVLAILPFEPELMKKLGGPPTTYVGHPLSTELEKFTASDRSIPAKPFNLLVLPGSRKGEIKRLSPVICETLKIMDQRGLEFVSVLPAVDHLVDYITAQVENWPVKPQIIIGKQAKQRAFQQADLALACSGTVLLELGLFAVPTVSIYKLDALGFVVKHLVYAWSACLPNLITDQVIIPERFEDYANPQAIARVLQQLSVEGPERDAQIKGFNLLRELMQRDRHKQDLAAEKILQSPVGPTSTTPILLKIRFLFLVFGYFNDLTPQYIRELLNLHKVGGGDRFFVWDLQSSLSIGRSIQRFLPVKTAR